MSSVRYSWDSLVYRPKSLLLFGVVALIVHLVLAALAYKTGVFTIDHVHSIPVKKISISLVEPTPVIPPKPVQPVKLKPKPKKKEKRKIITKTPSAKKISVKPKPIKKIIKPAPPIVVPEPVVSPLPSPVSKPTVFASPQPSYQPKPRYPTIARRRGTEGIVVFEISVANNGHVNRATIITSSGSSALDRAALKAIKMWKFPASQFNSLSTFKQKIEFRLNSY